MKYFTFGSLLILLLISGLLHAQEPYVFGQKSKELLNHATPSLDGCIWLFGNYDTPSIEGRQAKLLKVDKEGKVLLKKTFGEWDNDEGHGIVELPSGNLVIAGMSENANNAKLWLRQINYRGKVIGEPYLLTEDIAKMSVQQLYHSEQTRELFLLVPKR